MSNTHSMEAEPVLLNGDSSPPPKKSRENTPTLANWEGSAGEQFSAPPPTKSRSPASKKPKEKLPTPSPKKEVTPTPEKVKSPTPKPQKGKAAPEKPKKKKSPEKEVTPTPEKSKSPTPEKAKSPTPKLQKTKTPTHTPEEKPKSPTPTPEWVTPAEVQPTPADVQPTPSEEEKEEVDGPSEEQLAPAVEQDKIPSPAPVEKEVFSPVKKSPPAQEKAKPPAKKLGGILSKFQAPASDRVSGNSLYRATSHGYKSSFSLNLCIHAMSLSTLLVQYQFPCLFFILNYYTLIYSLPLRSPRSTVGLHSLKRSQLPPSRNACRNSGHQRIDREYSRVQSPPTKQHPILIATDIIVLYVDTLKSV